jgi:hypothetical protein
MVAHTVCRNPAYADGKLVFSLDKDDPRKFLVGRNDSLIELGTLFVGVNFEKGFGPAAFQIGKGEVDLSKLHATLLSYLEPWIRPGYVP